MFNAGTGKKLYIPGDYDDSWDFREDGQGQTRVKLRAVDHSTIQLLTLLGVLLTEMCYWPRVSTYIEGLLFNSLHEKET